MIDGQLPKKHLATIIGFSGLLLIPSVDSVIKYTGYTGLAAYLIAGFAVLYLAFRFVFPRVAGFPDRAAWVVNAAIGTMLLVIVVIGYPIANSGRFGPGSDVDDAMIIGATEIMSGRYPYYQTTYLGGPLSPMPGTLILSIPFVAIGILPFQNLAWLGILCLTAAKAMRPAYAMGILLSLALVSPTFYQVLVTGSDHITNTIYVLVSLWVTVHLVSNPDTATWKKVISALFLGVCLSSRANFLLLLPLYFSVLAQNSSYSEAAKYVLLSVFGFAAVTVPFWLYDPAGFSPLVIQGSKVQMFEPLLPNARLIIPGSTVILSTILASRRMDKDCYEFFLYCAVVQLYIFSITTALTELGHAQLNLGYGMFTLLFAVVSIWIRQYRSTRREPVMIYG